MNSASAPPPVRPPALAEATKKSTSTWQEDLQSLFHRAKDRFPDVVWDLVDEDAMDDTPNEEVWGHKGIIKLFLHFEHVLSTIDTHAHSLFCLFIYIASLSLF